MAQSHPVPVSERSVPSAEEIPLPSTDFVVLSGKIFALQESSCPLSELVGELRGFYQEKVRELREEFNTKLIADARTEWEAQIDHITKLERLNTAVIPSNLHAEPVIFWENEVCALRIIRYCPNLITIPVPTIKDFTYIPPLPPRRTSHPHPTDYKKVNEFIADHTISDDQMLVIKISQDLIDFPLWCMFSTKRQKILLNHVTFHRMSGGHTCTGRASAQSFWDSEAFVENMNVINCFSLANSEIPLPSGPTTVPFQEFFHDRYIKSISISNRGGGGVWTA